MSKFMENMNGFKAFLIIVGTLFAIIILITLFVFVGDVFYETFHIPLSFVIIGLFALVFIIYFIKSKLKGNVNISFDRQSFTLGENLSGKINYEIRKNNLEVKNIDFHLRVYNRHRVYNDTNRTQFKYYEKDLMYDKILLRQSINNPLKKGNYNLDFSFNLPTHKDILAEFDKKRFNTEGFTKKGVEISKKIEGVVKTIDNTALGLSPNYWELYVVIETNGLGEIEKSKKITINNNY